MNTFRKLLHDNSFGLIFGFTLLRPWSGRHSPGSPTTTLSRLAII